MRVFRTLHDNKDSDHINLLFERAICFEDNIDPRDVFRKEILTPWAFANVGEGNFEVKRVDFNPDGSISVVVYDKGVDCILMETFVEIKSTIKLSAKPTLPFKLRNRFSLLSISFIGVNKYIQLLNRYKVGYGLRPINKGDRALLGVRWGQVLWIYLLWFNPIKIRK